MSNNLRFDREFQTSFKQVKLVLLTSQTSLTGYPLGMFLMGIDLPLFSKLWVFMSYAELLNGFFLKRFFISWEIEV